MKQMHLFRSKKQQTITVIGELVIDEIIHEDNGIKEIVVGGSPLNIAINLLDLGLHDVRLFGTVGNDDYGKLILQMLKKRGINTSYIRVYDCPTSIVRINKTTGTPNAEFKRCSDKHILFTEELRQSVIDSSIVHFSYWPLSDLPSRDTITEVLSVAENNGTIIGFDPNYHEDLVTKQSPSKEEVKKFIQKANIMKPSIDDSIRLFETSLNNLELLNLYQSIGCELTVLSLGKDGVIASYQGEIIEIPTYATEVLDVTGAGDAFYAGMYMSIIQGLNYLDTLVIGSLCSACNLKKVGGLSDLPHITQLIERMNQ